MNNWTSNGPDPLRFHSLEILGSLTYTFWSFIMRVYTSSMSTLRIRHYAVPTRPSDTATPNALPEHISNVVEFQNDFTRMFFRLNDGNACFYGDENFRNDGNPQQTILHTSQFPVLTEIHSVANPPRYVPERSLGTSVGFRGIGLERRLELIGTYYDHCNAFFPIPSNRQLMLDSAIRLDDSDPHRELLVCVMMAKAASLENNYELSTSLLNEAARLRHQAIDNPQLETVLSLVIMANTSEYLKQTRAFESARQLMGEASQITGLLGLFASETYDYLDDHRRQQSLRVYWTFFVSSIVTGIMHGRPPHFQAEACKVAFPNRVDDDDAETVRWLDNLLHTCHICRNYQHLSRKIAGPQNPQRFDPVHRQRYLVTIESFYIELMHCEVSDNASHRQIMEQINCVTLLILLHRPYNHSIYDSKSVEVCFRAAVYILQIVLHIGDNVKAILSQSPLFTYSVILALKIHLCWVASRHADARRAFVSDYLLEKGISWLETLSSQALPGSVLRNYVEHLRRLYETNRLNRQGSCVLSHSNPGPGTDPGTDPSTMIACGSQSPSTESNPSVRRSTRSSREYKFVPYERRRRNSTSGEASVADVQGNQEEHFTYFMFPEELGNLTNGDSDLPSSVLYQNSPDLT